MDKSPSSATGPSTSLHSLSEAIGGKTKPTSTRTQRLHEAVPSTSSLVQEPLFHKRNRECLRERVHDRSLDADGRAIKRQSQASQIRASKLLVSRTRAAGVGEFAAVVIYAYDPFTEFWKSMREMIVENDVRGVGNLERLLQYYLNLNDPVLYELIHAAFAQVLRDLKRACIQH